MEPGQTISEYYSKKAGWYQEVKQADGTVSKVPSSADQVAFRAKVMVGVLVMAALFWATGAIPIGITALLVGAMMYFFGVLPPDLVAKAYAKDSVIFIFGVLAIAAAISKTGLDRRIGMLLLGRSSSLPRFTFIFAPLLAMTASFLSEHALVAFLAPILMLVYAGHDPFGGIDQGQGAGGHDAPAAHVQRQCGRSGLACRRRPQRGDDRHSGGLRHGSELRPVGEDGLPLRAGDGAGHRRLLLPCLPQQDPSRRTSTSPPR